MIVAILEDIAAQANTLASWLKKAGHEPVIRHDGNRLIELLQQRRVELLLLDWDVPGASGLEVLRWARATMTDTLPILIVTHHDGEEEIVYGLEAGADDYLLKPVRERELIARVNAQSRKYNHGVQHATQVKVGGYTLDPSTHCVYLDSVNGLDAIAGAANQVDGTPLAVNLPVREFNLALLLFSNAGRLVTKDFLIKQIWGAIDRKYDPSLATYVSKLRSMLSLRAKNGLVISTVYNYGYRLERR